MNNARTNFNRTTRVNSPEANKQPRSSIAPTILVKNGVPVLALGSPGSARIVSTVVQLITNIVELRHGRTGGERCPRFFCQKFEDYLYIENRIGEGRSATGLWPKATRWRCTGTTISFSAGAQIILFDPGGRTYQAPPIDAGVERPAPN